MRGRHLQKVVVKDEAVVFDGVGLPGSRLGNEDWFVYLTFLKFSINHNGIFSL